MTSFLLLGIIGVFVMFLLTKPLTRIINPSNKIVQKLRSTKWYHNHWLAGIFLFFINAALFGGAWLALYLLVQFRIPFFHLLVMIGAVFLSIFLWILLQLAWQGNNKNRLKMGLSGSSFYFVLALFYVHRIITLTPSYPGEDTFMAFIGLVFGFIVVTVAFITCVMFTGLPQRTMKR